MSKPKVKLYMVSQHGRFIYAVIPAYQWHMYKWLPYYAIKIGQVRP